MFCIAMAYGKEPLKRLVTEVAHGIAYIAKPSALELSERPDEVGVGFPLVDLYEYDPSLMDDLVEAYQAGKNDCLDSLWRKARPLPL
jgi:hypothetical protein